MRGPWGAVGRPYVPSLRQMFKQVGDSALNRGVRTRSKNPERDDLIEHAEEHTGAGVDSIEEIARNGLPGVPGGKDKVVWKCLSSIYGVGDAGASYNREFKHAICKKRQPALRVCGTRRRATSAICMRRLTCATSAVQSS